MFVHRLLWLLRHLCSENVSAEPQGILEFNASPSKVCHVLQIRDYGVRIWTAPQKSESSRSPVSGLSVLSSGLRLRRSEIVFRASGLWFRGSDCVFRASDFGFPAARFPCSSSSVWFRPSVFGFFASVRGIQFSGFRFGVFCLRFSGFCFRFSWLGFRASGCRSGFVAQFPVFAGFGFPVSGFVPGESSLFLHR